MKEVFIGWIVWQLLFIGWACAKINNEIADKTYKCVASDDKISVGWAMLYPLTVFIPEQRNVTTYCDDQLKQKELK